MAQVRGYKPDQATPLVVDKWRSDLLFIKLKTGELYTGFYQWWDDDGENTWNLQNRDADQINPEDIEWWTNAADIASIVEVE